MNCQECGGPFEALRAHKRFCKQGCQTAFNNRRFRRGAQLYDLFMTLRYERKLAGKLSVWSKACRLAQDWRREDNERRDGRKSWQDARSLLASMPSLSASYSNVRIGR